MTTATREFEIKIPPVSPKAVERVLNWNAPDKSFEVYYRSAGEDFDGITMKYGLAEVLIRDGRYPHDELLVRNFVPKGRETDPVVLQLSAQLKLLAVEEGVLKTGKKEKDQVKAFAEEVVAGQTVDAQEFKRLITIFGSSRALDILYRCRPEYRGIPVDYVRGVMADYLGDFLVVKRNFSPDDVQTGLRYLSDPDFRQGFVEVVKGDCFAYHNRFQQGQLINSQQVINEYLDILRMELSSFDNIDLQQAVKEVVGYYNSLFTDFPKPPQLINQISADRHCPDLNQLINCKEIKDKKRVLIADEMGVGKSFSVIFTKETLGLGSALIVAPSNVVETWQKYLSDEVSEDGKQVGYFKPGEAPKVLTVESPEMLEGIDISKFDYVLISQERLANGYIEKLQAMPFGMLVVDEVHKLKNLTDGKRAAGLIQLAKSFEGDDKYTVLLSGTPVPNKVSDVAMVLKLLYPEKFAEMDDRVLISQIVRGDLIDLRNLLLPRMQMKALRETVKMPNLEEELIEVELSDAEKAVYEVLLEEDELTASEKLTILRQFLLNPNMLDVTPNLESSKVKAFNQLLQRLFENRRKVVAFFNGYIDGVIRGERSILPQLQLPEGTVIEVIDGTVKKPNRRRIQHELNNSSQRMLVMISGQTADVGVDFSGGEAVAHYNEPWTIYEKRQEIHRVFRPGLKNDLLSATLVTKDAVEEGIHLFTYSKEKAVEKLLRGVPITDLEEEMLKKDSEECDPNLEVNPELAEYYFSAWDRIMKMFTFTKEIGEKDFLEFLKKYGDQYARCYDDLGNRSYQANAGRVTGTLIDRLAREAGIQPKIVDIASGPEMLKKHLPSEYQADVVSVDINPAHFQGSGKYRMVGSFTGLPLQSSAFDIANLSLALHYAKFIPSKGEFERLEVLAEMNRVLKPGGKALVNMIYSLDFKDEAKFEAIVNTLGFKLVKEYSGNVEDGVHYRSRMYTLEKVADLDKEPKDIAANLGKEILDGLKFRKNNLSLRDQRRILRGFSLGDQQFTPAYNPQDQELLQEEESVLTQAQQLKETFGSVKEIPKDEVIGKGFVRFFNGNNYILFKMLEKGSGAIIIR